MMRKILITASIFIYAGSIFAQTTNDSIPIFKKCNHEFIQPGIDLLIHFSEMSTEKWDQLLKQRKYEKSKTHKGTVLYTKGNWGENICIQSLSKSEKELTMNWTNFVDSYTSMDLIEKELKPYYVKTINGLDYYKVIRNSSEYIFGLNRNTEMVLEDVYLLIVR